jgi:hypothetical protein
MNSYHLVHKDGEWKLEAKGAKRATISFDNCTKREAVKQSADQLRNSANGASLRIHGLDGRIQEERTYHANSDVRRAGSTGRTNTSGPRKSSGSDMRKTATHKSSGSSSSGRSHTGGPRGKR